MLPKSASVPHVSLRLSAYIYSPPSILNLLNCRGVISGQGGGISAEIRSLGEWYSVFLPISVIWGGWYSVFSPKSVVRGVVIAGRGDFPPKSVVLDKWYSAF